MFLFSLLNASLQNEVKNVCCARLYCAACDQKRNCHRVIRQWNVFVVVISFRINLKMLEKNVTLSLLNIYDEWHNLMMRIPKSSDDTIRIQLKLFVSCTRCCNFDHMFHSNFCVSFPLRNGKNLMELCARKVLLFEMVKLNGIDTAFLHLSLSDAIW